MEWAEVDIYTTTEGIDVVTGTLTDLGVSGFVIKDSADFLLTRPATGTTSTMILWV